MFYCSAFKTIFYFLTIFSAISDELSSQTVITLSSFVLYAGSGSDDLTSNLNIQTVSTEQNCFTACLMTNNGKCDAFRYALCLTFLNSCLNFSKFNIFDLFDAV